MTQGDGGGVSFAKFVQIATFTYLLVWYTCTVFALVAHDRMEKKK